MSSDPSPASPPSASAAAGPPDRTFALRGLSPRDTLVFKSMVRLLSGKTRDRWTCVDGDQADLLVVAGDVPVLAARRSDTVRPGTQVIRVEAAGRGAPPDGLVLPLRADEVCAQLDRAGERIAAAPRSTDTVTRRLQLTRWPSALLLHTDAQYLRLATILGTRPTTMEELADKSGSPLATCHSFAAVMHGNGAARWILEAVAPGPAAHADDRADALSDGLLSRIRSRLSL